MILPKITLTCHKQALRMVMFHEISDKKIVKVVKNNSEDMRKVKKAYKKPEHVALKKIRDAKKNGAFCSE